MALTFSFSLRVKLTFTIAFEVVETIADQNSSQYKSEIYNMLQFIDYLRLEWNIYDFENFRKKCYFDLPTSFSRYSGELGCAPNENISQRVVPKAQTSEVFNDLANLKSK